jgi:hypothetical protein
MANLEDVVRDREPDIAWMVGLWLAIHGADTGAAEHVDTRVDETTALLAAALSARLSEVHGLGPVTFEKLEEQLGRAGILMQAAGDAVEAAPSLDVRTVDTGAGPSRGRIVWHCVYTTNGWQCIAVGIEA